MAVIQVQRRPLTLVERTYLPQLFGAMATTLKHFLGPADTMEYPEQRPAISPHYRGVPTLVKDPKGREKCVSCQLCEFVCPPKAIRITPGSVEPGIYCGLCEEVCPEEAIFLQSQYSMSGYSRAEMVNHMDRLYELGGTLPDSHRKWEVKKAAEERGGEGH